MIHRASLHRACVALLLGLHLWLAWTASRGFGPTGDENAHLAGGAAYWLRDDFRIHAENGVLAQRWLGLPFLADAPHLPPPDDPVWRDNHYVPLAEHLFFSPENVGALPRRLDHARAFHVVLSGLLLWLIHAWARSLWGPRPALFALALAALCPHLLAHAGLANSDLAAAAAFTAALLAWWRLLHRVSPGRILAAGLASGALACTKFSAPILAFALLPLLALRLLRRTPLPVRLGPWRCRLSGPRAGLALAGASVGVALLAVGIIWAAYGARFAAAATPERSAVWRENFAAAAASHDSLARFITFSLRHQLLPEAWLQGLSYVRVSTRSRPAFLAGEYSATGWREFFPVAFVLKTTLALQLLLILAVISRSSLTPRRLYRAAPLLAFVAVFAAFAIFSRINIGHRHLLPVYPALYVLAAGAMFIGAPRYRHLGAGLALGLGLWHAIASFSVRPHYLAYFNELAGGPDQGHRYLVDSSLDWGQGLPALQAWLARHAPGEAVHLSFFGFDRPSRLGMPVTRTGDFGISPDGPPDLLPVYRPGIYAISATQLQQTYTALRTVWSHQLEAAYQTQLAAHGGDPLAPRKPAGAAAITNEFDTLRFGRLCHFLRMRRPDALIGHAILVYRLDADDLRRYLQGPLTP